MTLLVHLWRYFHEFITLFAKICDLLSYWIKNNYNLCFSVLWWVKFSFVYFRTSVAQTLCCCLTAPYWSNHVLQVLFFLNTSLVWFITHYLFTQVFGQWWKRRQKKRMTGSKSSWIVWWKSSFLKKCLRTWS